MNNGGFAKLMSKIRLSEGAGVKRGLKLFLLMAVALACGKGYGQNTALPAVAPEDLQLAARVAMAQGVNWLKQKGAEDPDGWIVGPVQHRKVISWTNIVSRYSRKTYTVESPVYEYSNVVTFIPGSVGEAPRKVVAKRPVRKIGVKTVEQEGLVPDPKGPIIKEYRRPFQYDNSGVITWSARTVGDAALTVYALRQAGVADTDPVMQRMLENLQGHVGTFGLPDQTWDLAWLTAVFAGTPGDQAEALTQQLVSRLLDGQITEGPARGLWGPICVHHGLLAALLRDYLAAFADLQKKELRLKEKFSKAAEAARDEALRELNNQKALVAKCCQHGVRFGSVEQAWTPDSNADPKIFLPGADHCLYNQTVADMESSWVALTALSIASGQKRLPIESLRPKIARKLGVQATPLPPPERSDAVMARAANGLAAQQARDGRWGECNLHQPVTKFAAFTSTLPVPPDPKGFPPLSSPVTSASTLQGMAALNSVGEVAGMERVRKAFNEPYLAGLAGSRRELDAMLATFLPKPAVRPVLKMTDYDLILTLARPLAQGGEETASIRANDLLLRTLILAGTTNGAWGRGILPMVSSTSVRARLEALKAIPGRVGSRPADPVELNKAHLWMGNMNIAREAEGFATAVAVLYLAGHVENPATAVDDLAATPSLLELRADVEKQLLSKVKPGVTPTPAVATTPGITNSAPRIEAEPAVAADGDVPAIEAPPVNATPKADETF